MQPAMKRIYMDANATGPLRPEAREAMARAWDEAWANASSVHGDGQRARKMLEAARAEIAAVVGVDPERVVLTSGATEANVTALRSAVQYGAARGRRHVVVSAVEHPSVLETLRSMAADNEIELDEVRPDGYGRMDPEAMLSFVRDDTALVALMLANNEIGNLYDPTALSAPLRARGVHLHVDAVQALGRVPVDVDALGAATIALSAHKVGGPKGVGALVLDPMARVRPLVTGGHQERERRAGTEATPLVCGFAAAVAAAVAGREADVIRVRALRDHLETGLLDGVEGCHVNGDPDGERRLCNTVNVSLDGTEGETMLIALDLEGISVSSGSACTAGSLEPSHVLLAMGLPAERARAAVRFSLTSESTAQDVARVLEVIGPVVSRVRDAAPAALVSEGGRR